MNSRILIGLVVTAGLLFSCAVGVPAGAAEEVEPTVDLRWALGAWDAESTTPSAVKRDTQLPSGSRLKFLVEPLSRCSVYLILLDSGDDLHLLYKQSASASAPSEPTYVPPGSHKFELDDQAGRETFFLLASVEPLKELEAMLAQHAASDAAGKGELNKQIIEEIRRLHKAHRDFARPVEKPVMIGGQTRGAGAGVPAIDQLAVEISAERFYAKTISIDH